MGALLQFFGCKDHQQFSTSQRQLPQSAFNNAWGTSWPWRPTVTIHLLNVTSPRSSPYPCLFQLLWSALCKMSMFKKTTWHRGNNVKLVMHQISVDKIENPCYWINRCTFDMVLPSILSTQYWESLIFSPCIVIGEIEHFCVPRGQRRFFIKIEAKASICSWEVCFCCCTH